MSTTNYPVSGRPVVSYDQPGYGQSSAALNEQPAPDVNDPSGELTPGRPGSSQYDGFSTASDDSYIGAFGLF